MSVPAALDSKFSRLRLDKSTSQDQKPYHLVPYEWIYSVQIKDWPWEKETLSCELSIMDWVTQMTGVYYKLRSVTYKGKTAQIVTFIVDEERRLDDNKFTREQMEAVREQFGINRPFRWFELYGRHGPEDDEDGDSSGDEEYPPVELPRRQADDEDMGGAESDDESDSELGSEED
ncbi:uncharacterized protein FOMMEDRAFT_30781 [Fomitiporia mediterranea MF3/22]|uniref:uncharacterized protein n=1 Tax=Fomitiporia mediterranea (strain MF3/22) TaxID=694068 RepID=UPI00044088C1|nr:uncharacterized protein FOMMEDRAFT_30781 [Fomitiporia mediterranea MF3/22]EJD00116.1 hypothetical protein FOMMEDRAFT_30781 [Fomitiporia mediterranea MF3/22]